MYMACTRASASSGPPIQTDTPPYAFVYGGVYFLIRAGVVLVPNNYSSPVGFLLEIPTKYKHKR